MVNKYIFKWEDKQELLIICVSSILAIDDMRMNEKRGIAEVLQSAYMQLNAPRQKNLPTKDFVGE